MGPPLDTGYIVSSVPLHTLCMGCTHTQPRLAAHHADDCDDICHMQVGQCGCGGCSGGVCGPVSGCPCHACLELITEDVGPGYEYASSETSDGDDEDDQALGDADDAYYNIGNIFAC